jgi:hypothetical protein
LVIGDSPFAVVDLGASSGAACLDYGDKRGLKLTGPRCDAPFAFSAAVAGFPALRWRFRRDINQPSLAGSSAVFTPLCAVFRAVFPHFSGTAAASQRNPAL